MKNLKKLDTRLLEEAALAALEFGKENTAHLPLEQATERFRELLVRKADDNTKGRWLLKLGEALGQLGERRPGSTFLQEAVSVLKAGVASVPRSLDPLQWAATMDSLGNALTILGQRQQNESKRLIEAIVAYRSALEERTRDKVPLDWASTQNNLGNALQTIGRAATDSAALVEAAAAYRAALEERTRERVPVDWAATQSNLGNVLLELGRRQRDASKFEEAIAAYRAALEEVTGESLPFLWAKIQANLAYALAALGELAGRIELVREAIRAYHEVLSALELRKPDYFTESIREELKKTEALVAERDNLPP